MKNKKQAKLTCVMIAQQFDSQFWIGWDKDLILSKSIKDILTEMINRANTVATVSEAYGIKHDKDTLELYDSETDSFYQELKSEHGHFLLKFSEGATLIDLALAIGVEPQYIEKAKSGRYGYDNLLAYLIHSKDPDKFQYSASDVITILGKDYLEIYKEKFSSWSKGRTKKEVRNASEQIDSLIANILNGKITKSEILLSSKHLQLYALYKTKINEAFMTLGEIKVTRTKKALENGEFKKSIFFVTGKSGLGKSVLAKELVRDLIQLAENNEQTWSSVVTAGTNIFDEVNGEEILLLDDVRGDSLTASDWLKLLDPYNISPISARYHNKMGATRVIVITSTKHPLEFFFKTKGNEIEDLSQFIRRFDSLITIDNTAETTPIRYFQSLPKKVANRRVKIPYTGFETYLSYDFENNFKMNKKDLLDFLVAQVSLNNKWDLDKIKNSSEDTLASNSDEVGTEDSKSPDNSIVAQ
jgi:hypothetical protein